MVSVINQKQQAFISVSDFSEGNMNQTTFQTSSHRSECLTLLSTKLKKTTTKKTIHPLCLCTKMRERSASVLNLMLR